MHRIMIVPAAGRGTRLGAGLPKVLVRVNGRAMIDLVLDRHAPLVDRFVVVVAPDFRDQVETHLASRSEDLTVAVQAQPTGMLDAILAPFESVVAAAPREVWVTWCDQIAIRPQTTRRLAELMATTAPDFGFPTVWGRDPYIHFERDREGRIVSVLQRREQAVMPSEGEGDVGLFAMTGGAYAGELPRYAQECVPSLGTGERNFLPFIPWLAGRGGVVMTVPATDRTEATGVNTPEDLASVAAELARRTRR